MKRDVSIEFLTNVKVKKYLQMMVDGGLYGQTIAEAVERIVAGAIEDMVANCQLEEIDD